MAAVICSQKTEHGVDHVISRRALGASQSWFYKWKNRLGGDTPTARQRRRADLDAETTRLFEASGWTYGSPRITRDLHEAVWRVSVNTVAARMAELGLIARVRRKPRSLTRVIECTWAGSSTCSKGLLLIVPVGSRFSLLPHWLF